jgi:hypothetical protein
MPVQQRRTVCEIVINNIQKDAVIHKLDCNDKTNDLIVWFQTYLVLIETYVQPKRHISYEAFKAALNMLETMFQKKFAAKQFKARIFITNKTGTLFIPVLTVLDGYELLLCGPKDRCLSIVQNGAEIRADDD